MFIKLPPLLRSERFWAYSLVITIAFLTYLPLANHLGYYDDDWYILWTGITQGWQKIVNLHRFDRPFMGVIYALDYRMLGNIPLNWQLYGGFLRAIGAVAILWTVRKIWPENKFAAVAVAIFATVYPGFLMQPNANTYTNHIFSYTAGLLSLACMIKALSASRRGAAVFFTLGALVFGATNLLMIEYMIGIEAMRAVLLAYLQDSKKTGTWKEGIRQYFRQWLPYLIILISYLYWRLFLFESGRRSVDVVRLFSGYASSPLYTLLGWAVALGKDMFEVTLAGWFVHPYVLLRDASYRTVGSSVFFALATTGVLVGYKYAFRKSLVLTEVEERNWGNKTMALGGLFILFALLPVIFAGREVILNHSFTRYTIQAALGVALFLVGFLFYAVREPARFWVLALLLGTAIVTHYQNAVSFQQDWEHQKDLWWQFAWRVPDLHPGTTLVIMPSERTSYTEGYEIWGPANLIYNPGGELDIYGQVLNQEVLGRIIRGETDKQTVRGVIPIERDYDAMLLAAYSHETSCLHVVEGTKIELGTAAPLVVVAAAPYSRLDLILPNAPAPHLPSEIFGPEPAHTWCFYYQKMNLARQIADWQTVASLADEALTLNFKPLDRSEWMPVLEAYANTGREQEAHKIAKIMRDDKYLRHWLCAELNQPPSLSGYNYALIVQILCEK